MLFHPKIEACFVVLLWGIPLYNLCTSKLNPSQTIWVRKQDAVRNILRNTLGTNKNNPPRKKLSPLEPSNWVLISINFYKTSILEFFATKFMF